MLNHAMIERGRKPTKQQQTINSHTSGVCVNICYFGEKYSHENSREKRGVFMLRLVGRLRHSRDMFRVVVVVFDETQ